MNNPNLLPADYARLGRSSWAKRPWRVCWCEQCGERFRTQAPIAKYCCTSCRVSAWRERHA